MIFEFISFPQSNKTAIQNQIPIFIQFVRKRLIKLLPRKNKRTHLCKKLGSMGSFSASGIAADGELYFSSENGEIFVVKAGPDFELLSTNSMNDICMATPAISEGVLFFRTHHYLAAVSDK